MNTPNPDTATAEHNDAALSRRESEGEGAIKVFKELSGALSIVAAQVDDAVESDALASFEGTNYNVVSPEETADVLRFASDVSLMNHDLDHAITTLMGFKERLENAANARKRFISVVGRLPVEILSDIFVLARHRDMDERSYFGTFHKGFHVSFNAAQVCRRWRSIALNHPRLWTPIHLTGSQATMQNNLQAQLTMLSRTASLPLYLVVGIPSVHLRFIQKCEKGLLSAFEQRCKGLDIYAVQDKKRKSVSFPYDKIQELLMRFSKMEKLTIMGFSLKNVDHTTLSADWCNLTHLHLRLVIGDSNTGGFFASSMPRLNVLVLELRSGVTLLDPASLLQKYPNLTDFFLHGWVSQSVNPFSHARIERLAIHGSRGNSPDLLKTATFPSVTEISVPMSNDTEELVSGLVLRSGCQIRRLGLVHYSFSHDGGVKAKGAKIGERLAVPIVDYDTTWGTMKMMKDLKARWYEQEYIVSRY